MRYPGGKRHCGVTGGKKLRRLCATGVLVPRQLPFFFLARFALDFGCVADAFDDDFDEDGLGADEDDEEPLLRASSKRASSPVRSRGNTLMNGE